jgi:hypothetical protein
MSEERETLPMAGGCGDNCACGQEEREESNPSYATVDVFVEQYSKALREYLRRTLTTDGTHHIEDLGAHTASFSEAFATIAGYF